MFFVNLGYIKKLKKLFIKAFVSKAPKRFGRRVKERVLLNATPEGKRAESAICHKSAEPPTSYVSEAKSQPFHRHKYARSLAQTGKDKNRYKFFSEFEL